MIRLVRQTVLLYTKCHAALLIRFRNRRVARIWKRGGFFKRVRQLQATLTRIFIILESELHKIEKDFSAKIGKFERFLTPKTGNLRKKKKKVFTEIETDFSAKNRKFERFFSPKTADLQKENSLHQNWDGFFGQSQKFQRFFSPKPGDLQKKKVFTKNETSLNRPKSEIQTVFHANSQQLLHNFGTQIPLGGLFSFFQQKSASKAPKTCDFAYFTGHWGGLVPPAPPGYATV